eukprot:5271252-Amphidinium_carterae.1
MSQGASQIEEQTLVPACDQLHHVEGLLLISTGAARRVCMPRNTTRSEFLLPQYRMASLRQ